MQDRKKKNKNSHKQINLSEQQIDSSTKLPKFIRPTDPVTFATSMYSDNPRHFTFATQAASSGKQYIQNSSSKNSFSPQGFFSDSQKPYQKNVLLQELNLISISQLSKFMVHKGCYLKVQFVRDTVKCVAIQGRVKDHKGSEVDISIYNFDTKGKDCNQIFKRGTVIYVKEPFFKIALAGNQNVRIDNPEDIEFEEDAKIPETERYRQEGIELMKNKKYLEAYLHYDSAIAKIADEKVMNTFILNKAIVSYHLNLLHDYYDNARSALQFQPANIKALYHTFKALVVLGKSKKAVQLLQEKGHYFQIATEHQLKSFLEKVENTRKNKIDWYTVFKTGTIVGQYFSNKISIQHTKEGYSVIAKETIPPGEILIIENPFLFSQRFDKKQDNLVLLNEKTTVLESYCQRMYGISKNFRNKFNNFMDQKTLPINEQLQNQEGSRDLSNRCPITLAKTIRKNSLSLSQFRDHIKSQEQQTNQAGRGLFQKISMINYSDTENTERFCLGNTMIVFSTRQISEGRQVLKYFNKNQGDIEIMGTYCNCKYCQAQNEKQSTKMFSLGGDPLEFKRENLIQEWKKNKEGRNVNIYELFSEYYDFSTLGFIATKIGDVKIASKMFRRVFPMSQNESLQIFSKYLQK